jgi:hypothetical protein
MKKALVILVVLLAVFAIASCDGDETNYSSGGGVVDFLFSSDRGDAVKWEPIATASAHENKSERIYKGLVIEEGQ